MAKHQENKNYMSSPALTVQPALETGNADDEQEKEAGAVADKVMRMSAPGPVKKMSAGPAINKMSEGTGPKKEMSVNEADKGKQMSSYKGRPGSYSPSNKYTGLDEKKSGSDSITPATQLVSGTTAKEVPSTESGNPVVAPTATLDLNSKSYRNVTIPAADTPGVEYDYVKDPNSDTWSIKVTKLIIDGKMEIYPWPDFPHCMNADEPESHGMNTPNATSEPYNIIGPEEAAANSSYAINVWDYVVNQMQDYGTKYPAGPQWHSTKASEAHEMHHWNQDILTDSYNAGNWPDVQREMESVSVHAINRMEAVGKLTPIVEMIFEDFRTRFAKYYMEVCVPNDTPKTPMDGGYAAGKAVLEVYIKEIKDLAARKKWKKSREY